MVAVAGLSGTAQADKARADRLFEDGRKYLAKKEFALACTAFEQSQEADPAIGTELNIALCYEQWGDQHVVAAYHAYQEAERLATAKKDARAKLARKKVADLEQKLPHLQVMLPSDADTNAVILLDGKEMDRATLGQDMLVEAGDHTVEARVPGAPPNLQKVHLALAAREHVQVDVPKVTLVVTPNGAPPPPPPPPKKIVERKTGRLYGGIALAGLGGVSLGVASYVAVIARSDYNDAIASCPSSTCTSKSSYNATQDAISHANTATIVGGVGVVAAAVGVYLILTSHGEVSAAPMAGQGTVGLVVGGKL
jgi:hypothetical protein